jgi:CHAT domain-containing protein
VNVELEIERVQKPLKSIQVDVLAQRAGSLGPPTLEDLHSQLLRGCDILYLVCHGALIEAEDGRGESPYLLLEKADGHFDLVKADQLEQIIRALPADARPRLVVLASCQSGGKGLVPEAEKDEGEREEAERSYDRGALAAFGPRLVEAGIPAVIAMQDNIQMETSRRFMETFFAELFKKGSKGQVDRAAAVSRSQVRSQHNHLYRRIVRPA